MMMMIIQNLRTSVDKILCPSKITFTDELIHIPILDVQGPT